MIESVICGLLREGENEKTEGTNTKNQPDNLMIIILGVFQKSARRKIQKTQKLSDCILQRYNH
jgi:hypothetical protein